MNGETWYILLSDPAWVMYAVSIGISWGTFFLFAWWWAQTRMASEIYIYFTLMLMGNAISDMMALYSRTLLFINHEAYMDFRKLGDGTLDVFQRCSLLV